MGDSRCITNSSYEIGLNEGWYDDGTIDRCRTVE